MSPNQIEPAQVRVAVIGTSGTAAPATSNTGAGELRVVLITAPLIVQVGDPTLVTQP